jgi:tetratricopeptide (TPR) repeat protein
MMRSERKHFWHILCTVAVVAGLGFGNEALGTEASWQSEYEQGKSALTERKLTEAEQFFREALKTARKGKSKADIETCTLKLAEVLALRNETVEAQSLYKGLLASLSSEYGSNSKNVVPVLMALGSIQESAGDHTSAMSYYQRALHINEKHFGPYSPEFAQNLHFLGKAKSGAGKPNEATKHYRQAMGILLKDPSLGASNELQSLMKDYTDLLKNTDHSDRSLIKDFNTDILKDSGTGPGPSSANPPAKPETASPQSMNPAPVQYRSTPQLERIVAAPPTDQTVTAPSSAGDSAWQIQAQTQSNASFQSQVGEDPDVASRILQKPFSDATLSPAYDVVNDSILLQNRYAQGEEYYQRMIAIDIDALGPHHPSVANDLNGLAQFYMRKQNYAAAEPLLVRALGIYKQVYGENNPLTISATTSLALSEFRLGKFDRASELYHDALKLSQVSSGQNKAETARILNELGFLNYQQGKLKESLSFYEDALSSTEAAFGERSPYTAACLRDYAKVLRTAGQTDKADAAEHRANEMIAAKAQF